MGAISIGERLAGGVWGHLVGDAMGVPYEFLEPAEVGEVVWGHRGSHRQPPGTWSDDGGLMLALLDSLLTSEFSTRDQAERALEWWRGEGYKTGPCFDIGNTTRAAMERLAAGVAPEQAGGDALHNASNGSLMRILPIALVGRRLGARELVSQALRASALTHRHPLAQAACALYVLLAWELLHGASRAGAMHHAVGALRTLVPQHAEAVETLLTWSEREGTGYALDSFWSAWDAFASASDYRGTIQAAVAYGHDTDTTACIAGGLAGIFWGVESIPVEWRLGMRGQTLVDSLVVRLLAAE